MKQNLLYFPLELLRKEKKSVFIDGIHNNGFIQIKPHSSKNKISFDLCLIQLKKKPILFCLTDDLSRILSFFFNLFLFEPASFLSFEIQLIKRNPFILFKLLQFERVIRTKPLKNAVYDRSLIFFFFLYYSNIKKRCILQGSSKIQWPEQLLLHIAKKVQIGCKIFQW